MKAITRKELDELYNRARALKADRTTKQHLADNAADLAWETDTNAKCGNLAATVAAYNDAARFWIKAAGYTPKNHTAHMEYIDAAENARQMAEYFAQYIA